MTSRRSLHALLFICVTLSGIAAPQQPAAAKATLQGVVKLAQSGEPLAGARITLSSVTAQATSPPRETSPPLASVTTDRNGEFVLAGLDAGSYRFSVGNNGYVRYDSARIDLTAGQTMKGIVVLMKATGAISGRINSSSGRPLAGINVSILRRSYSANGAPGLSIVATAQSNDLGEYRAYWITPGRYYVTASGRGGIMSLIDDGGEFDNAVSRGVNAVSESYPQIFFPGVAEIAQASSINLQEGVEIPNINLTLPGRQQYYSIRGMLIDASTGQAPARASITLLQRSLTGSSFSSAASAARWYDPASGTFELPNLAPGRYGIVAQIGQGFSPNGPAAGASSVSLMVTIESSDIENLKLALALPPVIAGRIRIEGQLPQTAPVDRLRVSLIAAPALSIMSASGNASATVAADGAFKLAATDGEFRVAMSGLPTGFYLKEARMNEVDVLNITGRFSTAGNLEILISGKAGQLSGRVFNEQMRPAAGVDAVLIPSVKRDRAELFKRAATDSDGRFTFTSITPGDYKVFAWERLEANSYFDEDVLKLYEEKGAPVHVGESSNEIVDVKVIPEGIAP